MKLVESLRIGTIDYDFENSRLIGGGLHGKVYEITSNKDGETYAAKFFNYSIM